MKIFRDGGKLNYLLSLKCGGKASKKVSKKGEGGQAKEQTALKPIPVKNKLSALISSNFNLAPRTNVNGIEHQAFQFPNGNVRQYAYGDGYRSVLDITPQGDSSVVYNNNVGMQRT